MTQRALLLSTLVVTVVLTVGCATRGPRDTVRVSALAVGEAVLALDRTERSLYEANAYDKATHDRLGAGLYKVLTAARAYERVVAGVPEGEADLVQHVETARTLLLIALREFEALVPPISGAREPLLRALAGVHALLAPVNGAQIPINAMALLTFIQIVAKLLQDGRTTWTQLRETLQKTGATDEELAHLDQELTHAIERRKTEHGL